MNTQSGFDPIERLRERNPVHAEEVPSASLARVAAKTQENIMTDLERTNAPRSRRSFALVGSLAAAGALALVVALGASPAPRVPGPVAVVPTATVAPTDPGIGGGGMAMCIAYDTALLKTFDVVFDGTVTSIDGDQITFTVNEAFKGPDSTVTLTNPDGNSIALNGAIDFAAGERYLVSASEGNISSCGFTLPYDADETAAWKAALSE